MEGVVFLIRKTYVAFLIFAILILANMFIITSCSNNKVDSNMGDENELAKLPEEYPLSSAPLFKIAELISISDKNSENYISYDITFNSDAGYDEVVEYYSNFFKDPITKDFGIALNLVYVPEDTGYMCNFSIFSNKTKGTKGNCTITMSVSTY